MTKLFVKFVVVLVFQFRFCPPPKRGSRIYPFGFCLIAFFVSLIVPLFFIVCKVNWERYMVGVTLNNIFDCPTVSVFYSLFCKIENHSRSLAVPACVLYFKAFLAVAYPFPSGVLGGFSAYNLDFFRNHKSGIKTYAELPDKVGVFFCVLGKFFQKRPCPRTGDSTK